MKTIKEIEEKLSGLFQAGWSCPDCGPAETCPVNIALAVLKVAGDNWKKVLSPVAKLLFLVGTECAAEARVETLGKLLREFDQKLINF